MNPEAPSTRMDCFMGGPNYRECYGEKRRTSQFVSDAICPSVAIEPNMFSEEITCLT
jgi:hypothetical protein